MEIEEFKTMLKSCKKNTKYSYPNLKVTKYTHINRFKIYKEHDICSKCGHSLKKEIIVDFYRPIEHLTMFEVNLLYSLFALKKIPYDYAQYHKCQAGKEFIENLKNVIEEDD